jgi:Phage capsid protein
MSISLAGTYTATTNAAIASYGQEVKLAYQGSSRLRDTVKLKTGVVGQQHFFQKLGLGVALQQTSSAQTITPADYSHSKVAATLTNWRIGDYTDLFDQAETTVDERADLAKSNAMALGRAEDQLILDAIDAQTTGLAGSVSDDLGGSSSPLNAAKLRRAKRLLVAAGVAGMGETPCLVIDAIALEGALAETEVTSADYQTMRVLVDADLDKKTAFGFKFVVLENRAEGGLPVASTITTCFGYVPSAVGLATAIEPQSRVDFIPEKASWLSQAMLKAGSTVIDAKGVVKVDSYGA